MVDIQYLIKKGEHAHLEAKKAAGGIPESIWESYSAFANTAGGVILMGVSESKNELVITGVDDAQGKIKKIWDVLNNQQKISTNILMEKHVYAQQINGKDVIVMEIPRADRHDKPVYINNDLFVGTFRRNNEGDYHCPKPSVKAMLRDQSDSPADSSVMYELTWKDLDTETITRYRNHFNSLKPSHVWNALDTLEFLKKTGAVRKNEVGMYCPTLAGLVFFGTEDVITQIFPDYFLDYREKYDNNRWSDRVVSNLGEWSGNIYDFFFKIADKLCSDIKRPFKMRNYLEREDDTPVHKAVREALANAVIHADYWGRQGIVIEKSKTEIKIANPGSCRPDIQEVKEGGVHDPRNPTIFRLFAMLDIGERAGSGVFNICRVWEQMGWREPRVNERFDPERTIVTLPLIQEEQLYVYSPVTEYIRRSPKKSSGKSSEKNSNLWEYPEISSGKNPDLWEDSEAGSEKSSGKSVKLWKSSEKISNSMNGSGKSSEKSPEIAVISEKSSEKISNPSNSSEKSSGKSSVKIINIIKGNPLVTIEELSGLLKITTRAVEKNLCKLKANGFIERIGPDKGGNWKVLI